MTYTAVQRYPAYLDPYFLERIYDCFDMAFPDRVLLLLQIYEAACERCRSYHINCEVVLQQVLQTAAQSQHDGVVDDGLLAATLRVSAAVFDLLYGVQKEAVVRGLLVPRLELLFEGSAATRPASLALFSRSAFLLPEPLLDELCCRFCGHLDALSASILSDSARRAPLPFSLSPTRQFIDTVKAIKEAGLGVGFAAETVFGCAQKVRGFLGSEGVSLVYGYFADLVKQAESPVDFHRTLRGAEGFLGVLRTNQSPFLPHHAPPGERLAAAAAIMESPYFEFLCAGVEAFDAAALLDDFKALFSSVGPGAPETAALRLQLLLQEGAAWAFEREVAGAAEFIEARAAAARLDPAVAEGLVREFPPQFRERLEAALFF